ncbi:MAG TPA: hypothetical protein VEO54_12555 [Thermoanaerobaculia bacterium]|nr:hypothetical protein [Thermoanaerobaculia bacterium]
MNRALLLAVLLCALTTGAQQVRYRSADTIYLTVGSAAGVQVGDRFEIVRDGKVIATVEVIFVAENSSSAKVVNEQVAIKAGDTARALNVGRASARPAPAPPELDGLKPVLRSAPFALSGTASFDSESATDANRTLGRLSLRARNIADLPLHARIRARAASTESGNRLYEASVTYDGERLGVQAGRIGNSPYVGLGYLDGALVRLTITEHLHVGAFGGLQPDIRELTFDADSPKYGGFIRVGGARADLVLAAATVDDNPFLAVDGRWAPSPRISLFAHGRAGDEAFNTMVGLLAQVSARQSVTVAYERVDPGPDDDLRTDEQRIDDFLRQGLRVSYRGPYATLGAGVRSGDEESDEEATYSVTAGIGHPNLGGFYTGINATGFSSELSDGVFAQARLGRRFGAGHSAELAVGAFVVDETAIDQLSTTGWLRGAVWIELPYDLFARAEAEVTRGETRGGGHRVSVGAGYRF